LRLQKELLDRLQKSDALTPRVRVACDPALATKTQVNLRGRRALPECGRGQIARVNLVAAQQAK